jgi:hypothetical protein
MTILIFFSSAYTKYTNIFFLLLLNNSETILLTRHITLQHRGKKIKHKQTHTHTLEKSNSIIIILIFYCENFFLLLK